MSSVIQTIEAEAMSIIEEARKKAQSIIEEAKARAKEVLEDKSYLKELEEFRREVEAKLRSDIDKIVREAQVEAAMIKHNGSRRAEALAKKVASIVAGIEL